MCTDSMYSWGKNAYMTNLGDEKACASAAKRYKRCTLKKR